MVSDGFRAVLDLAGQWDGQPATLALAFPPPAEGWRTETLPSVECSPFITNDETVYSHLSVPDILTADGKAFKETKKQAAWYRRHFDLAGGAPAGKRVLLHCDGIAFRSCVWLNGTKVGESLVATAPSTYDVTAAVRDGPNELVVGVTGRAGLVDIERKTCIAPTSGVLPGIWGGVRLELAPSVRMDDVWVRTLVEKKRLEVDVTLVNEALVARTVVPSVVVRGPVPVEIPQVSLTAAAVTINPGETRTVTLTADWLAPHLWTPETPALYRAEAFLLEQGAPVDRSAVRFGFREFTRKGRDFLLNGRRQVLLRNSMLAFLGNPLEAVAGRVREMTAGFNCLRLHLNQINPSMIDQADASGMMIIPEFWGWYDNEDHGFPRSQADVWAPGVAEAMVRLVRQHRNHPSVIMWSMANETFWNSTDPALMAIGDRLIAAVRGADPTRLLQGDGEVTWGGRLDAINIHYPEGSGGDVPSGEPDTAGRRYEDSGLVIPNDFEWLKKEGESRSWRASFLWDRPLMIGEYHAQDGTGHDSYSSYMGDAVYDRTKWQLQAMDGNHNSKFPAPPHEDNGWLRMVRVATDHYRAMGVACLNPWTGTGRYLMPPLAALSLDYHPNALGGEPYVRRVMVVNDTGSNYNELRLQCDLVMDGRKVCPEVRIPVQVAPGERQELTLSLTPPAVTVTTQVRLILRLCCEADGNPQTEMYRHEEDVWICPRASLAGEEVKTIALVDGAEGLTAKALAALGLKVVPEVADDAALANKRLLVIGEEAVAGADLAAAVRFAGRGGEVLVLHQTKMPFFLPGQPRVDFRHAASMSWKHANHPALTGLSDGQLRWWRPDHLVATRSLVRPASGPSLPVTACGGRSGMHWSTLVEVPCGQGAVTFCQYLLCDRVTVEPAAGLILAQAVRAALAAKTVAAKTVAPAPRLCLDKGIDLPTREMLAACNIAVTDGFEGKGPVLVNAATPPDAATQSRLRARVEAGGRLWLRGLDEKTAPAVATLLPWKPGFVPLTKEEVSAACRADHPLLAGIGTADLFWAQGSVYAPLTPTTPLGGPAIVPPSLQSAVLLTEPSLLVAASLGKGLILMDQLGWDKALASEAERATRVVSCLARNLGAGFRVASAKHYRWSHLDLKTKANRSYYDEVAGDGKGGWTDQGANDMRYFLINHTGKVNGMPVATESFPKEVSFNEIPFQLIDPKSNDDKAVLTLRGGPHDPSAPAEVRGLAVGGIKAERLWFLHAACWASSGGYGVEVARYEMVYADGTRAVAPVRQGREVNDWWNPTQLSGAAAVWTGRNEKNPSVGIYSMPWNNPHPEKPIASIDVVGNLAETQIVLLGVTFGTEEGGGGAHPGSDRPEKSK